MNCRIEIDKTGEKWQLKLIEYDSLPFDKRPEEVLDTIEEDSFFEAIKEIGMRNWVDKLKVNI